MDVRDARSPSPVPSEETVLIPRGSREDRAKRYHAIRDLLKELKGLADEFDTVGDPEHDTEDDDGYDDDDDEECTKEKWKSFLPYTMYSHDGTVVDAPYPLQKPNSTTPMRLVHYDDSTTIEIWSETLRSIFLEVVDVSFYSGAYVNAKFITIGPPWIVLYHELERLKSAVDASKKLGEADRKAFKALYYYATTDIPQNHFQNVKEAIRTGVILYADLWALFPRGSHVVSKDHLGNWVVSKVVAVKFDRSKWLITTSTIVRAGDGYHECFSKQELEKYDGMRSIADLELRPLDHLEGHEAIRADAIKRGKLWQKYCESESSAMSYEGRAIAMMQDTNNFRDDSQVRYGLNRIFDHSFLSANIIVDSKARTRFMKQTDVEEMSPVDLDLSPVGWRWFRPMTSVTFSDDDYLRCPATHFVFDLDGSAWYSVNVENIKPRQWSSLLFERTVLDPWYKQTLQTLVNTSHCPAVSASHDVIKAKGRGLVLLFHGPSGTGKTMTAEALAESTQRPILKISPGYLANHEHWEQAVEQLFELATAWNAILLVDEGEFLTHDRRYTEPQRRKSWLSALMQRLDYFQGVVILTTCRLCFVDNALGSRVSFAVHFKSLTTEERKQVWTDFIEHLDVPDSSKSEFLQHVDKWSKVDMDGRQIRNVFDMAARMSQSGSGAITTQHIGHALDATRLFINHRRGHYASLEPLEADVNTEGIENLDIEDGEMV